MPQIDFSAGTQNRLHYNFVASLEISREDGTSSLFPESIFSVVDLEDGFYLITRFRQFDLPLDTPVVMTSKKVVCLDIKNHGISGRKDLQDYKFEVQELAQLGKTEYAYLVTKRRCLVGGCVTCSSDMPFHDKELYSDAASH